LALEDSIIRSDTAVFDYGCGRGSDVRLLLSTGITAEGWDPAFRPSVALLRSAVVNFGYVANVVEDRQERDAALRHAWSLTTETLVVSARLVGDAPALRGAQLEDGVLTRIGTFQKFFRHEELRGWITSTLGVECFAASPGIFYVFRQPTAAEAFLASRVRAPRRTGQVGILRLLYERHRALLDPLITFVAERGRVPHDEELQNADAIRAEFGSLKRAFAVVRRAAPDERWDTAVTRNVQDLLVYVALSRFGRRPPFSALPVTLRHDIREFFRSYASACNLADDLLRQAGKREAIEREIGQSSVGKRTPNALYCHVSALTYLPPLLRVYEGCGRVLAGQIPDANIIKLHLRDFRISYLAYPGFDKIAHPALVSATSVDLRRLLVETRDYAGSPNPPILHRKELFLGADDPRRARFARLTALEERHGLYSDPAIIGTAIHWASLLANKGLVIRGHRLTHL
jgi:DNA phosphorothioation-associated putative methyltransferase